VGIFFSADGKFTKFRNSMANKAYKYLFGPVPSRRLGISLGVDLVPHKTCSLNCIYCECGATTNLTLERKAYVPTAAVLKELALFLQNQPRLDVITFSGSGEPTLHSGIGEIIQFIKKSYPVYKLALLTNGTLLHLPEVREAVQPVDFILPSLDAVSDAVFRKINRPVAGLNAGDVISGLVEFRKIFAGQMWLEIFIVPGVNDHAEEIARFKATIRRIQPDQVQLNTLDRPGAETWVRPETRAILEQIATQLDWPTEIIANFKKREQIASYQPDIESTLLQTIKRRPCTVEDLATTLGLHPAEINKYIEALLSRGTIVVETLERGLFFKLK
jgi:wyosine [tRNA(Phe)-imidazoG37] synthetase (radical SAM superfamily)